MNPNLGVRSGLHYIGETIVENYYFVMSSKQIRHLTGHYINPNGRMSAVVFSKQRR